MNNESTGVGTNMETISGTEMAQRVSGPVVRLPKTDVRYWRKRLQERSYTWVDKDGREQIGKVPYWQVRVGYKGRREWFNTETASQEVAARRACDFYTYLKANGWAATLAKYKPQPEVISKVRLTVGDYIAAVREVAPILEEPIRPKAIRNYVNCFQTIVAEVFGVRAKGKDGKVTPAAKYDYRGGGHERWVASINGIRLARITPAMIDKWKNKRLKHAGGSVTTVASAKRTINSYIRCGRSLFTEKIRLKMKGIELPSPLPFDGIQLIRAGKGGKEIAPSSVRYTSRIDARAIIAAAKNELAAVNPEAYKIFLLGIFAGLRKAEIDSLEWRMVDFASNEIRLEETDYLHLKTASSSDTISMPPGKMAELKALLPAPSVASGSGPSFVVKSSLQPKKAADLDLQYYRCEAVFKSLYQWLRGKGITANKPLHELRKEAGAIITTDHGIYAASSFLRHSDITTTSRHYADLKKRITVDLGDAEDANGNAIPPDPKGATIP